MQAKVGSSEAFSADVTIDNAGTTITMYYRIGSGPAIAAWSGIHHSQLEWGPLSRRLYNILLASS